MPDRFELIEPLGRGGMGVVWRALEHESGQLVALKLLHDLFKDDPGYVIRFEREVEVARRINSPYVVQVLGFGKQDGAPYMAMELVEGQSLRDLIKARGKLSWGEARPLLAEVAAGLAAAHRAGVIHRDMKPSNVLITHDGHAKLADFGIARALDLTRLTGSSTMVGTPHYMAPDSDGSESSDLYAFGCVCYEVLTGHPPFEGNTQQEVLLRHIEQPPDTDAIPAEARALVAQLLAKHRRDRPRSAALVAAALAAPPPGRKKAEQPLRTLPKPRRTGRLILGGALLTFFLAAGAAGTAAYFMLDTTSRTAKAAAVSIPGQEANAVEANLLVLVNDERAARGLAPVTLQPQLAAAAGQLAALMAVPDACARPTPSYADLMKDAPAALLRTPLHGFVTTCGTFKNAAEVFANWLATPNTAEILLEPKFDRIGIGTAAANGALAVTAQFAVLPRGAPGVDTPLPVTVPAYSGVSVTLSKIEFIDDSITRLHFEIHNTAVLTNTWRYAKGQEPRISVDGAEWHVTDRFGAEGSPAEDGPATRRIDPGGSSYTWVEMDWVPPPGSALRVGDVVPLPPIYLKSLPGATPLPGTTASVTAVRLGAQQADGTTPIDFTYDAPENAPFLAIAMPILGGQRACSAETGALLLVSEPYAGGKGKGQARIRTGNCTFDAVELRLVSNAAVLARVRAELAPK